MSFWNKLFGSAPPIDFASMVKEGALIIDVRTADEFRGGYIKGSLNIPLDRLQREIPELKKRQKTIITCCRSGNRSGMAKRLLSAAGLNCYNGGAWDDLQSRI